MHAYKIEDQFFLYSYCKMERKGKVKLIKLRIIIIIWLIAINLTFSA